MIDKSRAAELMIQFAESHAIRELKQLYIEMNGTLDLDYVSPETGHTALYEAVENKDTEMVDFLLSKGANPNTVASDDCLPFYRAVSLMATENGYDGIVQRFFKCQNLDLNKPGMNGRTALFWTKDKSLLTKMIDAGASINVQDENGNTPLMDVCRFDDFDLVAFYLKYKPDLELKNNDGKTLIEVAYQYASELCEYEIETYMSAINYAAQKEQERQIKENFLHLKKQAGNVLSLKRRKQSKRGM